MTAQEECLRQRREYVNEMIDEVNKAAINYADAKAALVEAKIKERDAFARLNEASGKLKMNFDA